ncbi:MAG: sigma factor-like helix-turn-helix DNA-binding protein [Candidatus Limnocylindrales bacterium]
MPVTRRDAGRAPGRRTCGSCRLTSRRILPADEPSDSRGFDAIVQRDQLETAIRRLSVDHRSVLVLHHYADLPLERVAQILEVPIGTVYSRFHHAMRAMRAAIDADARPAAAEAIR